MNKGWHIYYWVAIVILLIALGLSRQAKGQITTTIGGSPDMPPQYDCGIVVNGVFVEKTCQGPQWIHYIGAPSPDGFCIKAVVNGRITETGPCGNAQMAVPDAAEREQELQEEWEDCSDMRPTVQEWCKEVLK